MDSHQNQRTSASSDGWDWDDENPSSKNDNLQESDMTPMTDGSTSEEDTGWLGSYGADFLNSGIGAIGDIASFVQRSALSVAAELAQLERDSGDEDASDMENYLRLPWEVLVGDSAAENPVFQDDAELKTKILVLSVNHDSFLKPFSVKGPLSSPEAECNFITLDEPRIHLIRRLLDLDENLAATHAHLSGRSDVKETVFWTNYFFNCERVRREHLESIQSNSIISTLSDEPGMDDRKESTYAPAVEEKEPTRDEIPPVEEQTSRSSSQNSLVPADDGSSQVVDGDDDDGGEDDDSSYIQVNRNGIASPPCSLMSVEDVILVNKSISKDHGGK